MRIPRSLSPSSPDRTHPVAVGGEMKLEMADGPVVAASAPTSATFSSFRLLQVLILALTVAGVVIGLRVEVPGGVAPVDSVAFGLTLVWALVDFVDTRARDRTGSRSRRSISLRAVDTLVAIIALTARRGQSCSMRRAIRVTSQRWRPPRGHRDIVLPVLLALPDGRLHQSYSSRCSGDCLRRGLRCRDRLVVNHEPSRRDGQRHQPDRRGCACDRPPRARYVTSIGYRRDRMEWFGIGVTLAVTVALVATVCICSWVGPARSEPSPSARRCWSRSGSWPARAGGWGRTGSRGLVQVLAVFGFVVVVSAIYLVVVLGLGHTRRRPATRRPWRSPWSPLAWPP